MTRDNTQKRLKLLFTEDRKSRDSQTAPQKQSYLILNSKTIWSATPGPWTSHEIIISFLEITPLCLKYCAKYIFFLLLVPFFSWYITLTDHSELFMLHSMIMWSWICHSSPLRGYDISRSIFSLWKVIFLIFLYGLLYLKKKKTCWMKIFSCIWS